MGREKQTADKAKKEVKTVDQYKIKKVENGYMLIIKYKEEVSMGLFAALRNENEPDVFVFENKASLLAKLAEI